METNGGAGACRGCRALLVRRILDLGRQPVADLLVPPGDTGPDPAYPLGLALCDACLLVQLSDRAPDVAAPHGHGAAFSSTAQRDIAEFAEGVLSAASRSSSRQVVSVGSTDDVVLDAFHAAGGSTVVVEPGRAAAEAFLDAHDPPGVVLAHHALAHVDDLDDAIAGMARLTSPAGVVAIEAHHVLGVAEGPQFDVVSHAHRSYLSLVSLERLLSRHGLVISGARRVDAYGGSIRVTARLRGSAADTTQGEALRALREVEHAARLDDPAGYAGLAAAAARAASALHDYLAKCRADGTTVIGYGAPARGTTLLNLAGITPHLLPFTVDRSPAKQDRLLPGCRIPVRAPEVIEAARPDRILVLPWPLRSEIERQLASARSWGGRFVVALPELAVS